MSKTDFFAQYHARHDCKPAKCACKCGCTQMLGCTNMTDFCSTCHLSWIYDDEEHGPPNQPEDGPLAEGNHRRPRIIENNPDQPATGREVVGQRWIAETGKD